jgi:hypothetical protein
VRGIRERVSVKEQGYVFGGNISCSFEERGWGDGERIHDSPISGVAPSCGAGEEKEGDGMCKWIGTSGQ